MFLLGISIPFNDAYGVFSFIVKKSFNAGIFGGFSSCQGNSSVVYVASGLFHILLLYL